MVQPGWLVDMADMIVVSFDNHVQPKRTSKPTTCLTQGKNGSNRYKLRQSIPSGYLLYTQLIGFHDPEITVGFTQMGGHREGHSCRC